MSIASNDQGLLLHFDKVSLTDMPLPNAKHDARVPFTELMALERIDYNTYQSIARPWSPGNGNRAFGGHVYAQAAYAAAKTVGAGFAIHVCR